MMPDADNQQKYIIAFNEDDE